jgi:HSP20 family protein
MNNRALTPINRNARALYRGPITLFDTLQREVDRLFEDFSRGANPTNAAMPTLMPSMNAAETDKEIELSVELPGLEEGDVDISLIDNVLTIRGEKKAETEERDRNYLVVERAYGSFYRAFELPQGVDPSQIRATMSNGILKIRIPKPERAETRRIQVQPGEAEGAQDQSRRSAEQGRSSSRSEQAQSRAQQQAQSRPQNLQQGEQGQQSATGQSQSR